MNYLSYGHFPPYDIGEVDSFYFPRGVIVNRNLNEVQEFDPAHVWAFAAYVPLHLYLVLRSDVLYDRGAVSSMISGNKLKHDHIEYEDAA